MSKSDYISFLEIEIEKLQHLLVQAKDVENRKESDLFLYLNYQKIASINLYEEAPIPFQSLDKNGVLIVVNSAWCKETGYEKADVIGQEFTHFLDAESVDAFKIGFGQLIKTKRSTGIILKIKTKKGGLIDVQFDSCTLSDSNGNFLMTNCVFKNISEKLSLEKAIIESEENLRTFFNNSNDMFFIVDLNDVIVDLNQCAMDKLGYTKDELVRYPLLKIHPESRHEEAKELIDYAIKQNIEAIYTPLLTKNKHLISVETRVKAGVWNGQKVWFGVSKDISALKVSEIKFSTAFLLNPSICGISDLETGRYIEVNQAFVDKLGFHQSEVIGKTASELNILSVEQRDRIKEEFLRCKVIRNIPAQIYPKTGNALDVLLTATIFEIFGKLYNYTIAVDISEIKQIENQLKQSETYLKLAQETAQIGHWVHHIQTNKLEWSDEVYKIFDEHPLDIVLSLDGFINFVHPEDRERILMAYRDAIDKKRNYNIIHRIILRNGQTKYVNERCIIFYDHQNRAYKALGTVADVTNLVEKENRIKIQNSKLIELIATKDKIFSIIAHDLRTPYTAILGYNDLIQHAVSEHNCHDVLNYSNQIHHAARQSFDLLDNLLQWSRIQTGRIDFSPTEIRIKDILNKSIDLLIGVSDAKNIEVRLIILKSSIFADQFMLETICRNLLSNAIKFTPKGGQIDITARASNGNTFIEFKDNGLGMSPDKIDSLLHQSIHTSERGTLNEKGSGLGFQISKEFIEIHKAKLNIVSQQGKGTSVQITFPDQV